MKYLEDKNITGYIPNFGLYKPYHEGFTYYPEGDYYQCSQGVKLPFKGIQKRSNCDKRVKQYWTLKSDCKNCPLKENCTNKQGIKMIHDTVDKPYYDRMYQKVKSKKGLKMKKIRSATVEPVIGTLLYFRGMKKVYTKGIKLANKHVIMACIAYNLKKLMLFKAINPVAKAMDLSKNTLISAFIEGIYLFYTVIIANYKLEYKNILGLTNLYYTA